MRSKALMLGAEQSKFQEPAAETSRWEAFAALYRQQVDQVYRYHLSRTGITADAEDLTAETFEAALESYSRFSPERGSPKSWIMGIAHHKLIDYYRRSKRDLPLEEVEETAGTTGSPETWAETRLQMARVAAVLRRLSPERAEALALHFFADLSLAETAQAMGKSYEATKKLVQRGLSDLKEALAGQAEV